MRLRGLVVGALLVGGILLSPAPRGHAAGHSLQSSGIELTVTLPRATYPHNALALVTIHLHNTSPHTLMLAPQCGDNPGVEVLNSTSGAVVYPPIFPSAPGDARCRHHHHHELPASLPPGGTLVKRVLAILRGSVVRPTVAITQVGETTVVRGSVVRVPLAAGRAPSVTLITTPDLSAVIHPPVPVQGPLFYVELDRCGVDSNITLSEHLADWRLARGDRIVPHWPPNCPYPFEWHAIAGWLGQPVAHVDYLSG